MQQGNFAAEGASIDDFVSVRISNGDEYMVSWIKNLLMVQEIDKIYAKEAFENNESRNRGASIRNISTRI